MVVSWISYLVWNYSVKFNKSALPSAWAAKKKKWRPHSVGILYCWLLSYVFLIWSKDRCTLRKKTLASFCFRKKNWMLTSFAFILLYELRQHRILHPHGRINKESTHFIHLHTMICFQCVALSQAHHKKKLIIIMIKVRK